MSADQSPRDDLRYALNLYYSTKFQAAVAGTAADELPAVLALALATLPDGTEMEKRWPALLAMNAAMAEAIGSTCLAWPEAERDAAVEDAITRIRETFKRKASDPAVAKILAEHDLTFAAMKSARTKP